METTKTWKVYYATCLQQMVTVVSCSAGVSSTSNWLCSLYGASCNHSHHWNWHQPRPELRRGGDFQPQQALGWSCKLQGRFILACRYVLLCFFYFSFLLWTFFSFLYGPSNFLFSASGITFEVVLELHFMRIMLLDVQWIFWVGPFLGAALAAAYHQYVLRAGPFKALGSFRSAPHV